MSTQIAHRKSLMPTTAVIRRGVALAIALSATLLASGCGSDGGDGGGGNDGTSTDSAAAGTDTDTDSVSASDTTPASEDNADSEEGGAGCDLISDDVAAQILGIDIVRREPHEDATTGGVSCIKGTERVQDLSQASYVSVSATPGGAAFFDQTVEGAPTESVPGVGDRAEFLADAASLIIAVDTYLVTVQVVKGGVPSSLDDCLTVAEDVLSNL